MKATVTVLLKPEVPDNTGRALLDTLHEQGFHEILGIKVGKHIDLEIEGTFGGNMQSRLEKMCRDLFSNPEIEDFEISIATED